MANATYPSSLPGWRIPTTDKADSGVVRTQMDNGPDKVRRRYSATAQRFQTRMKVDGTQRYILEDFYHNSLSEGALRFDRKDPVGDGTSEFRFLGPPNFEILAGGELPSDRIYEVTLKLERMPGERQSGFTVLIQA